METCSTRMGCRKESYRIIGRGRTACTALDLGDKAWLVSQEMLRTLLQTLLLSDFSEKHEQALQLNHNFLSFKKVKTLL